MYIYYVLERERGSTQIDRLAEISACTLIHVYIRSRKLRFKGDHWFIGVYDYPLMARL